MRMNYRHWVRSNLLREEPSPILSESVLQRIWFEQLVRHPLITLTGEKITLHQPGVWNHRAGPDFLRASFSTSEGRTYTGDVELHRHSSDWSAHAHSENPAYRNVLLHVFWQADPSLSDTSPPHIRSIAIEHQLSAPLTELISLFRSSPAQILTGEKPGHCHPLLVSLPPEQLRAILEEAGWHRLRLRRSLAQARCHTHGFEQATWVAVAEGLGFSENRKPFASLARAVPIEKLLQLSDPADREAVLYGVSRLLPDPTRTPVTPRALPYVKDLWKRWWFHRELWSPHILPPGCWKLGATRPNNSPFRRVGALSCLTYPLVWQSWIESVRQGDADVFLKVLRSLSHPFWDHHASWDGRILPSSSRLIGIDRASALLFHVLGPMAECSEADLGQQMETWPAAGDAGLLRSASMRLLGTSFPPADVRSQLAREGLLQIYKDFCRAKSCRECSMPEFLQQK